MHRCRHKDIAEHNIDLDTQICKDGGNILLPFSLSVHIKVFLILVILTMLFAKPIMFTLIYS